MPSFCFQFVSICPLQPPFPYLKTPYKRGLKGGDVQLSDLYIKKGNLTAALIGINVLFIFPEHSPVIRQVRVRWLSSRRESRSFVFLTAFSCH